MRREIDRAQPRLRAARGTIARASSSLPRGDRRCRPRSAVSRTLPGPAKRYGASRKSGKWSASRSPAWLRLSSDADLDDGCACSQPNALRPRHIRRAPNVNARHSCVLQLGELALRARRACRARRPVRSIRASASPRPRRARRAARRAARFRPSRAAQIAVRARAAPTRRAPPPLQRAHVRARDDAAARSARRRRRSRWYIRRAQQRSIRSRTKRHCVARRARKRSSVRERVFNDRDDLRSWLPAGRAGRTAPARRAFPAHRHTLPMQPAARARTSSNGSGLRFCGIRLDPVDAASPEPHVAVRRRRTRR